jgi:hypothetical protein
MRRDTQENKPRFDLLVPLDTPYDKTLLYRWAMLMERGMDKYGYRNWEKANSEEELQRFYASLCRHFFQFLSGEDDEDHAAAVCFNLNAVLYLKNRLKNYEREDKMINFEYEYVERQEDVRKQIKECEGKHTQQAIYSTFHDALTQICYGCKKVRTTIKREE